MAYRFAAALLCCAAPVFAPCALAQGDPMATSQAAFANQLGMLEY